MKIDLLKIIEDNKKIDELRAEAGFRQEINKLIVAIVNNEKEYYTDNKENIEKLNLKYEKDEKSYSYSYIPLFPTEQNCRKYVIRLTKENIKKIQKYVNEESE